MKRPAGKAGLAGQEAPGNYFFGVGAPVAAGPPGEATLGLEGANSAELGRTLGGLLALAAGECAPETSSGFCSGGA